MVCGYRISVLHRLPKPDRRVRLPMTACFQHITKTFLEKTMNPFDMVKNLAGMQSQLKAAQEKLHFIGSLATAFFGYSDFGYVSG